MNFGENKLANFFRKTKPPHLIIVCIITFPFREDERLSMRVSIVIIIMIFQNKIPSWYLFYIFTLSSHQSRNNRIFYRFYFCFFCYHLRINIWKNFSFRHAICDECLPVSIPQDTHWERDRVRENTEQCKMETDNRPSASCILKYKQLAFGFASDCSTWRCSSCTQSFQISNFAALFHWIQLFYTLIHMFCCHRAMPVFHFSLACFARNFYSSILELFNSILFSFFSFYFFFALYFAIVTRK